MDRGETMIIDSHVHIGGNLMGHYLTEDMVIEAMDKYKIDFSLVSNLDSAEYDHNLKRIPSNLQTSQENSLSRCLKFAKQYPDRIGVLPWIKPASEMVTETLIEQIKNNRQYIYGLKVHPYHSKTPFDGEKMQPYIQLARTFQLPIATHTGGCDEASPRRVYEAAKRNTDIKFIMVHMGLQTSHDEAMSYIERLPNLYGDTTWVSMEDTIRFVQKIGSKRILFGSDMPIDGVDTYDHNPRGDENVYRKYFDELETIIGTEAYQDIMYRNGIKVFSINKTPNGTE